MRTKPERTRASKPGKPKVTKTPQSEEAKVSALELTLKLHFRREARLQERVPRNKRNLHQWASSECPVATTLTRKEEGIDYFLLFVLRYVSGHESRGSHALVQF